MNINISLCLIFQSQRSQSILFSLLDSNTRVRGNSLHPHLQRPPSLTVLTIPFFLRSTRKIYSKNLFKFCSSCFHLFLLPFQAGRVPQGRTVHTRRRIGSRHGWFPCQGDHRLRATGADVERLCLDNIPTDFPYGAGSPSTRKIPRLMREIVLFLANPRKYRPHKPVYLSPYTQSHRPSYPAESGEKAVSPRRSIHVGR